MKNNMNLIFFSLLFGMAIGWSIHFFTDSQKPGKAYFFKNQWENCLNQLEKEMSNGN